MTKSLTLFCSALLLASSSFADSQELSFAGIWQDTNDSERFYSIHERGDAIVLIDLPRVEQSDDSLGSAYIGKLNQLELTRVGAEPAGAPQPGDRIELHFTSSTDGMILPTVCDVCSGVVTTIRKVF